MKELSDADFGEFIKSNGAVVIDFWADWCGPCKMIAPVFEELSREMGEKAVFAKLDISENPDTAGKFSVSSIPAFLIFKNGELAGQLHGAMPKEDFRKRLEEIL